MIPIGTKPMTIDQIRDVLKTHWGYDGFLPLQQEAMRCVLDDRDSVVVLPTGGGKSLCFQAPAVVRPGVGLVVSPLISLMNARALLPIQFQMNLGSLLVIWSGCPLALGHFKAWCSRLISLSLLGSRKSARSTRALSVVRLFHRT